MEGTYLHWTTCEVRFSFYRAKLEMLKIFAGRFPSRQQIIWLIVLIVHIGQLAPEIPPDKKQLCWHSTGEFKEDYKFARSRALALWCWLQGNLPDEDKSKFVKDTLLIEETAWKVIGHYQNDEKGPKDSWVSYLCVCGSDDHDFATEAVDPPAIFRCTED